MELEFFGVLGSAQAYDASADFCGSSEPLPSQPKGQKATSSGHTIVLSDLDSDEELLRLEGEALTHLRICNMPLDCQRAL
jgi:hypothetical protein